MIHPRPQKYISRLDETLKTLRRLKRILRALGVQHATVFGSIARGEDGPDSDIDLYLDYGDIVPDANHILPVEGKILEAFRDTKVDFVSNLSTAKGRRLKIQIDKDGKNAF